MKNFINTQKTNKKHLNRQEKYQTNKKHDTNVTFIRNIKNRKWFYSKKCGSYKLFYFML